MCKEHKRLFKNDSNNSDFAQDILYREHFSGTFNIVTEILHFSKKGAYLENTESVLGHIYRETVRKIQLGDKHKTLHKIFKTTLKTDSHLTS
jgi:hypothetical protein